MFSKNKLKDKRYSYNDNGRIIIPNNSYIKNLPEDGGELWNRLVFEKFKEIFPSNSSSIFDISNTVFFGIIIPSKFPEKSLVSELLDNLWPSVATVEIKFLLEAFKSFIR